jgi:membrane protease YdiL (CAAX protease family)
VLRPRDYSALAADPSAGGLRALLDTYQPLVPIPILVALLPLVWLLFRDAWRALDEEAHEARGRILAQGKMDYRPFVALAAAAFLLTIHEYYGGRLYFEAAVRPLVDKTAALLGGAKPTRAVARDELLGFAWWAGTRVVAFTVAPLAIWKIFFREDTLADLGLSPKGFWRSAWIYAVALGVAVPAIVSLSGTQMEFAGFAPFVRGTRPLRHFVAWEVLYFTQFFAMEVFFRGFCLGALRRSLGAGAIFCVAVPYTMTQFAGSYLRASGSIVLALVLGSLSLRTKSVYRGLFVHVVVAGLLGWLTVHSTTLSGYASPGLGHALVGFQAFMATFRPLIPVPSLLVVLPLVWLFFRGTWRELDEDAHRTRGETLAKGRIDPRPFVAMVIAAMVLTLQEYYGGRIFFDAAVRPLMQRWDAAHGSLKVAHYDELYGFAWWAGTRIAGYTLVPFGLWKIIFRRDSLLDLGLRTKGFWKHAWIYGLFLGIVLPAMWIVSREPDFGTYYPFYKNASRSWWDFLAWEAMYFAQFLALEMFFRGWWLGVLRKSFGSAAIFCMAVPYCMIHYGKPYLEANGAIVAGIALGSLSMKTRSIYQGFLVHVTVAGLMDWLALSHRHALPTVLWPGAN